jgi:uncharacterized RDD family membrane protein YckC
MNSISITTAQNIDVEYVPGSLGDRIVARLIDKIILGAYIIVVLAIIGFSNFSQFTSNNGWIVFLLILPVVFYHLICELAFDGQSAGKKVMAIKVISLTGEQPSIGQYLNRWIFRLVDFTLTGNFLAVIMVAVSEKKQRLGDLVAGTAVVKTKVRKELQDTIYQPVHETSYQVTYPQVTNLKDSDVQIIKEVVQNVRKTGNTMLALQAQQKLEQILQIMSRQAEPMQFLQVVLADYNYITSQL